MFAGLGIPRNPQPLSCATSISTHESEEIARGLEGWTPPLIASLALVRRAAHASLRLLHLTLAAGLLESGVARKTRACPEPAAWALRPGALLDSGTVRPRNDGFGAALILSFSPIAGSIPGAIFVPGFWILVLSSRP